MKLDYSYQKDLEKEVLKHYAGGTKELVLAAGCSSGKTRMSIEIAEKILKAEPDLKILVLAHGQSILKLQYYKELEDYKPKFTYGLIHEKKDSLDRQVTVAIPQSVGKHIHDIDILIVDEAHQFYFAEMVQGIVKRNKPKFTLLLTGTPTDFVAKEYPMVVFSVAELLDRGVISDPRISLIKSDYHYTKKDLNPENELASTYKLSAKDTEKTMEIIEDKIKGKTMIACRDTQHARDVNKYLLKNKYKCLMSTASNDPQSENIKTFLRGDHQILIVVYRSILGFSFNELQTIVDVSGSHNPERLFQLFSRSIRKSKLQKYFFKVTTEELAEYTFSIMSLVMALTQRDIISTYTGDINNTRFMIPRGPYDGMRNDGGHSNKMLYFEYEFDTLHRMKNTNEYAWTSIREVKKLIDPKLVNVHPFRLKLIEMAKAKEERPPLTTKLGKYLSRYTAKSSPFRDEGLIEELTRYSPGWFETPREAFYREIFALAKSGGPRPTSNKDPLAEALRYWRKVDKNLEKKLKMIRPDWFVSPIDEKKKELLEMAKRGGPRPGRRTSSLMESFLKYSNPNSNSYDPEFMKKIKKANPLWA